SHHLIERSVISGDRCDPSGVARGDAIRRSGGIQGFSRRFSGGVAALNRRLMAWTPSGSIKTRLTSGPHPVGIAAISRWLSAAIPPACGRKYRPRRGRSHHLIERSLISGRPLRPLPGSRVVMRYVAPAPAVFRGFPGGFPAVSLRSTAG